MGPDDPLPIDVGRIFKDFQNSLGAGSRFGGFFGVALVMLAVLMVLYNMAFVYVRPNEFGIKLVRIGVNRGVQEKVYDTGLHLVIPAFQEMYRLPKDTQVLEMTNNRQAASRFAEIQKAAHIQTSDGFYVAVDVSILYRIEDPYLVFTKIGPGNLYISNGIVPKAEPALKATLGELTTEEFYNSPLRVAKTELAKKMLNRELNDKGIIVEQVLVRYFLYSEDIQKNIEEKKLKDQLVFKNRAEGRAAGEEAILKKVIEEGEANLTVKLEEGHAYVTTKLAARDLYVRKKKAAANLAVKLAEAESLQLKNAALEGQGSERLVGLNMADALKGVDVLILPSDGPSGVNPLNLDRTLKLFDVRKGGAR